MGRKTKCMDVIDSISDSMGKSRKNVVVSGVYIYIYIYIYVCVCVGGVYVGVYVVFTSVSNLTI